MHSYLLLSERPELILKVATSYTNAIAVQDKHRTQCRRFGTYHHLNSKTKGEKDAAEMLLFKQLTIILLFSCFGVSKKKERKKRMKKESKQKKGRKTKTASRREGRCPMCMVLS
jgi:hypothetical protein